jgi:acyl carrier protein
MKVLREKIWKAINDIIAESLGEELSEITPEKSFVQDFYLS